MAVFSNTIITKKGHALVTKGMAGEQINFTKVRTSDYDYPSSTNFENLTVLGSIKQTVDISAVNIENESTVRVKAAILNTDVTSGYYVKNIGLYANDPDEGEILFSITTATTADFMPAYNGVNTTVLTVDLLTTVSNSGNVNLTVSPGGLVTTEMIATENQYGITTIEEMWKQDSLVIGGEFGGKFPVTNIEVGKVYYYFDNARNMHVPYTALKTATGTFNAPNINNFKESTFKGFLTQRKILLNTPVEIFILPRNGIEKNAEVVTGQDYKFAEAIVRIYKAGTFDHRITLHALKGGVFRQEDSALTSSGSAITNFEKSKYRLNMYPFADKVYFDGVHYATGDNSNVVVTLELLTIYN